MKKTLTEWKRFLKENTNNIQVYCDMDGVLVDFESGVIDYVNRGLQNRHDGDKLKTKLLKALDELGREHNITLVDIGFDKSTRLTAARNYMYKLVGDNREFWANLEWTPDGKELWNVVKQYDPNILSAPMLEGSKLGKIDWIKKNLGLDDSKITLTGNKFEYATPDRLLIDDMLKYLSPWIEAGGKAIHHSSARVTIKKLKEMMNEEIT